MRRTGRCARWLAIAAAVWALGQPAAHAQVPANVAAEAHDWGVTAPSVVRTQKYHAPTPASIPGGRVVNTVELHEMRGRDPKPFLVDVLSGPVHRTIPGAIWMHNGGLGDFDKAEEKRFLDTIAMFLGHDKAQPIVFFCSGMQCWLSYNAALRAIQAGYTNVLWYRGGIEAWRAAGLPTTPSDPFPW